MYDRLAHQLPLYVVRIHYISVCWDDTYSIKTSCPLKASASSSIDAASRSTLIAEYNLCEPSFSGFREMPVTWWPRLISSTHRYEPPNPAGPRTAIFRGFLAFGIDMALPSVVRRFSLVLSVVSGPSPICAHTTPPRSPFPSGNPDCDAGTKSFNK